jgi:hypothetical protein
LTIAVGDVVRIHYHPPGQTKSFVEGVVSRADVTTELGQMFVIDVTSDVIYDREQPFRPGYQDYILYQPRQDFPGRIELLPRIEEAESEDVAGSPSSPESELECVTEHQPEQEIAPEPAQTDNRDTTRGVGRVLGALFGRRA